MRVELRPEAHLDVATAAAFYDCQRIGLGDRFVERIYDDLRDLEQQAGIHAMTHGYHCKPAKRFPFAIYYRVVGEVVDVVAILDCRQDPERIANRLN